MKRSAAELEVSDQKEISPEIFKHLPPDLVPKILSYTGLTKSVLISFSRALYNHFCYINHETTDPIARENWRFVCAQYPWLIAANNYDCQRAYYLLIKEDNLEFMEQLLREDVQRKKNMREVIIYLFNKPFNVIGSDQMRALISHSCLRECGEDALSSQSSAAEDNKALKLKDMLVNGVMTNDMDTLEITYSGMLTEYVHSVSIVDIFNHLFKFCTKYSLKKLLLLTQLTPLCDNFDVLENAVWKALQDHDYDRAQYLFDHGANLNLRIRSTGDLLPIVAAVEEIEKQEDYRKLLFLVKNKTVLDLATEDYGDAFELYRFEQAIVKKAFGNYLDEWSMETNEIFVSALLYAVLKGNATLVKILLDGGADSEARQWCRWVPNTDDEYEITEHIHHFDLLNIAKALGNQAIVDAIVQARKARVAARKAARVAAEKEWLEAEKKRVEAEKERLFESFFANDDI